MEDAWRTSVWRQFGAAIDMLDDALRACPPELWREMLWPVPPDRPGGVPFRFPEFSQFWYVVYHTLFWLDLYLTGAEEGFVPPAPFALIEQHDDGPVPDRVYTKAELEAYLQGCRQRCQAAIESLTGEAARRRCRFGWGELSFAELLLYNMRHVQEHAAQLGLMLGQRVGYTPGWAAAA
jgi:hypothetical protein